MVFIVQYTLEANNVVFTPSLLLDSLRLKLLVILQIQMIS